MYDHMIAVTNRWMCENAVKEEHLPAAESAFCPGSGWYQEYMKKVEKIASLQPRAIVLREKDLSCEQYLRLASQVLSICSAYGTELILHNFEEAAEVLNYRKIHLPLEKLKLLSAKGEMAETYERLGTSVHSLSDALEAERLGAGYVFAGNIYETDCKKGLPGRGLSFLQEVCENCSIPVYAIGGITPDRLPEVRDTGAAGGCMMSGFMRFVP